jgi:branched-subunit amino acid ABC-type transport system permease component
MRAVADDARAAALLGVRTERVVIVAFLLAGALAGFAGLLIAPQAPIGLQDGVLLGLKGMTAALLGRLGSLRLALAGGLVLGVLEGFVLASSSLGARWADTIVLALLALLAATRPRGLLARSA